MNSIKTLYYTKTFNTGNLAGISIDTALSASDVSRIVVGYRGRDVFTGATWTVTAVGVLETGGR